MLQIRHDDETNDDHEKPRCDLLRRDDIPCLHLIGILPRADIGADVLGYPDEKRDEEKGDTQRHPPPMLGDGEIHGRPPEEREDGDDEKDAEVVDEVVGKEIDVYERA